MHHGPWSTDDFDDLSWHDVHVYGFRLDSFKPDEGASDLKFDIDFILNWESAADGFLFTVCKAELTFHEVFGLKVVLDYATPAAGMCPFSMSGIERTPLEYPSYHWRIPIDWPSGLIEFDAPRFSQYLIGEPTVGRSQSLDR